MFTDCQECIIFDTMRRTLAIFIGLGILACTQPKMEESKALNEFRASAPEMVNTVQTFMGSRLKKAVKDSGTAYAVSFCTLNAHGMTDSAGQLANVSMRRVSDKHRNPQNKASDAELEIIRQMKDSLALGTGAAPVFMEDESKISGYFPLMTMELCVKCHGMVESIDSLTYSIVRQNYPDDQATGYSVGDLRGLLILEKFK